MNVKTKTHLRVRKRIGVAKGVGINVGKKSISATVQILPGISLNIGRNGIGLNLGLPGTGLGTRTNISFKGK